jgi:hypothetical protein
MEDRAAPSKPRRQLRIQRNQRDREAGQDEEYLDGDPAEWRVTVLEENNQARLLILLTHLAPFAFVVQPISDIL